MIFKYSFIFDSAESKIRGVDFQSKEALHCPKCFYFVIKNPKDSKSKTKKVHDVPLTQNLNVFNL